jgi:hypothetical protein
MASLLPELGTESFISLLHVVTVIRYTRYRRSLVTIMVWKVRVMV